MNGNSSSIPVSVSLSLFDSVSQRAVVFASHSATELYFKSRGKFLIVVLHVAVVDGLTLSRVHSLQQVAFGSLLRHLLCLLSTSQCRLASLERGQSCRRS